MDNFDDLLNEDAELDYGDQWSLNFNYNLIDTLDEGQRRRGWKIFCSRAYAKYVCLYFSILYLINTLQQADIKSSGRSCLCDRMSL